MCTSDYINARRWQVRFLDPLTGNEEVDPRLDPLTDFAIEVLGWTASGSLIVVSHTARQFDGPPLDREFISTDEQLDAQDGNLMRTRLVEWRPGQPPAALAELAEDIRYLDIPRDLVVNGRFGGPSPEPSFWPLSGIWLWGFIGAVTIVGFVILGVIVAVIIARHRRRETGPSHS